MQVSPLGLVKCVRAFVLLLAAIAIQPLAAAESNPSLTARVQGINSQQAERGSLRLARLDVRVRVHGTIAETVVTASFANPSHEVLEGDFTFAMPAGSVVTGYALDVGGTMIDGVLVDQRRARLAYEARVRAGVDPGLAEVGRDNLFRTRVFPIFAGSGRTIRLRFATPLDPREGYVLPLAPAGEIGELSLEIEAGGGDAAPIVRLPEGIDARWESRSGTHRLAYEAKGRALAGTLAIQPAAPASPLLLSRHPGEGNFFQIVDSAPAPAGSDRGARRVAILWDRSLSRADDDLDKEIGLVRAYLERTRPSSIELVLFDSGGVERIAARDAADAAERLRAVRYRGGTSLAGLAGRSQSADSCLLFTDGLVTIDRRDGFRADCPLFVVSSARDADRAWLAALARGNGGEAFDLAARPAEEILTRLTRTVPRVVEVRTAAGAPIDFTLLDGGQSGWRIVGPMPESGDVLVRLAGLAPGITERLYSAPSGSPADMAGAGALWAADRIGVRAADDDFDRAELLAFSRRYSVASPGISFLVLETANDYAQAAIEPPPGYDKRQREAYDSIRRGIEEQERSAREARLGIVLAQWEEQKTWWQKRFDPNAKRPRTRDDSGPAGDNLNELPQLRASPPSPSAPPPPPPAEPPPSPTGTDALVTGVRIPRPNLDTVVPVTSISSQELGLFDQSSESRARGGPAPAAIQLAPWAPDRPYLKALDAASPATLDAIFAEQQAKHGALPAFWLDVAEWHFRKGRRAEAVSTLLSALELPTRNSQTLSIVAERLIRYGEVDRAIFLLERLAAAEPDRPQPRRTLALALAGRAERGSGERRRADLARAISLLTEVIMTPWPNAYDGIESISLMEVNRLIPPHRAAGGGEIPLDPRLVALLDVDVRVVIEWNSESTDIDLWVDEPNGERAVYNNPRTAIGGRLSNDMTQGYGPEEYLLRRAPAGAFTVRAHVYSPDRINPNGASNVTARLIRNWGRPSQSEQVVDIELLPDAVSRERLIGRIDFRR